MNTKAHTTRELGSIDIAMYRHALGVCPLDVTVLGDHVPRAFMHSQHEAQSLVTLLHSDSTFRGRFCVPDDWFVFGYVLDATRGSWCHAIDLERDVAFLLTPGHNADFLLKGETRIAVLLQSRARVAALMAEKGLTGQAWPRFANLLAPAPEDAQAPLRRAYTRIWESDEQAHTSDEARAAQVADTLRQHVSLAFDASPKQLPCPSRARMRHYATFHRAVQFMEEHLRDDLYVEQICAATSVSERGLRYAFIDLTGLSPMRYLRMLRLSSACRTLASSDVARRSVKSIAIGCGMHDLSRFASAYHRTFGEGPYNTLLRVPASFRASG